MLGLPTVHGNGYYEKTMSGFQKKFFLVAKCLSLKCHFPKNFPVTKYRCVHVSWWILTAGAGGYLSSTEIHFQSFVPRENGELSGSAQPHCSTVLGTKQGWAYSVACWLYLCKGNRNRWENESYRQRDQRLVAETHGNTSVQHNGFRYNKKVEEVKWDNAYRNRQAVLSWDRHRGKWNRQPRNKPSWCRRLSIRMLGHFQEEISPLWKMRHLDSHTRKNKVNRAFIPSASDNSEWNRWKS